MIGVEIDMVVSDSLKALELYEKIFEIERIEVTDFPKGENEVIFSLYGVRFHMLDENPQFEMIAPKPNDPKPIWFNIMVPEIAKTYQNAINEGCVEIQPITEMLDYGVSNAMFSDSFGYLWMLHQVHKEVTFEERKEIWEKEKE
ncbi:putative glyoxalase superfamily protein PhnB [Acetoanaerobium pronyense]|uniref:Glyoxalase superfamily protein PhnB n=1 Tax=Acetoanaerobium pronyense TaxID=1482736 RepID=A0ABS4KQQ3_9FIRM|nr:VOC family protein [Acetoanaerobium pronyense]MBP2028924.1 putative glyoxalase superfamily protein PhnB [Acetoanaerobium pronyense]